MRALTVVQLVPALHGGGAERSTLEIGQALVAAGHRSVVVSAGGRLVETLRAQGSEHITLDLASKTPLALRRAYTLRQLLRAIAPDIVHARSRLPAWLAAWALRGLPQPRPHFVTTVHGLNTPGRYSAVMLRGERIICVSKTVREYALHHYPWIEPERLRVVPRGIDPAQYPYEHQPDTAWRATFAAEHPQLQGMPLLVMPARGTRLKGHHDAIALVARLAREHGRHVGLMLVGTDEPGRERYVAEIRELARTNGVAERVVITAPRSDLREIYACAALVLQLSRKPESFGRTVVEALAMGKPVVGYAHGGVGELLGELLPTGAITPGDEAALAVAVVRMLDAPPAIAPMTRYRLADMQAATLGIYAELIGVAP
jgi:glycosyltransferase involved in cell wall biosynthesis